MSGAPGWLARLRAAAGRIWLRLLLVNLTVVLVPVAGLEFAHIYERQLLSALERDMNNQAALVRALLEDDLGRGIELEDARHHGVLRAAARRTRTRVRVLSTAGSVLVDSHQLGPPEGPEPRPPKILPQRALGRDVSSSYERARAGDSSDWPDVAERREIQRALAGIDAAQTRIAHNPSAVFLFSATPVYRHSAAARRVTGAVYVTRSTNPVLLELYRIRSGLFQVLGVALLSSAAITLLLAFSISRPLTRLSKAARRIARGERGVALPVGGSGEIRELAQSFKTMTEELDARLDYISEFSADVAHEFKSPLTSIRGAAELLAEGAHEDAQARERFLRNILLDTERLDRLVSRLLELSRIEASLEAMTVLDLHALLDQLTREAAQQGRVELEYRSPSTWICGRRADLHTAFKNLLDNARRYSPPDHPVQVSAEQQAAGVMVAVSDSGPGIAEAHQQQVFQRFYTTDAERGGTGLGLSIVQSVIKAHGGSVTLRSQPGRGTCFYVWLPLAAPSAVNS
ncbi:MAG TPA: ATP-binding protein [Polyangiaceae bacterium]|nr:ATP-binding protein [Polyangiaceae bacterium]